jgi:hypothetical protein
MMTIHEMTRSSTKPHEKSTLLLVLLRDPFRVISWIVSFLDRNPFFSGLLEAGVAHRLNVVQQKAATFHLEPAGEPRL